MTPKELAIAGKMYATITKGYATGVKAFQAGLPQPPKYTPELLGWETAQAMDEIRMKAMESLQVIIDEAVEDSLYDAEEV